MYGGKGISREYLTKEQLKQITKFNLLKTKLPDNKYHGLNEFTEMTGINVENNTLNNFKSEDEGYKLRKSISDYLTDIFFKEYLSKNDTFFIYTVLNKSFKQGNPDLDNTNLCIKGSLSLGLYTEKLYEDIYKEYKDKNNKNVNNFLEFIKPKASDLDIIVPYPIKYTHKPEKMIAIAFKTYKQFGYFMKHNNLIFNILDNFSKFSKIQEILGRSDNHPEDVLEIRKNILKLLGHEDITDDILKNMECEMAPISSKSFYTRIMNEFESESYKLDIFPMMMSFKAVEGILQPMTKKIAPYIITLAQVVMNVKITYKGKYIKIKIPFIDLVMEPEDTMTDIVSYELSGKINQSLYDIKKYMLHKNWYSNKIYTISAKYAIMNNIYDMLYCRNLFIWEDEKLEKRLNRDIIYNIIFIWKDKGCNDVYSELTMLGKCINKINKCDEKDILKCLKKIKCDETSFSRIFDYIRSMVSLLLNKDKLPPYLKDNPNLYNQYIDEFNDFITVFINLYTNISIIFKDCNNFLTNDRKKLLINEKNVNSPTECI